jgi:hypothetical protein
MKPFQSMQSIAADYCCVVFDCGFVVGVIGVHVCWCKAQTCCTSMSGAKPVTRKAVADVGNLDPTSRALVAALEAEAELQLSKSFDSGATLGTGTFGRYCKDIFPLVRVCCCCRGCRHYVCSFLIVYCMR